jgi:hypothetical protein
MAQHSDVIVDWYTDILGDDMPPQCNYDLKAFFQGDGVETIGFASQACGATQVITSTYIGGLHATSNMNCLWPLERFWRPKVIIRRNFTPQCSIHLLGRKSRYVIKLIYRSPFESWFALDESWRVLLAFGTYSGCTVPDVSGDGRYYIYT